MAQCSYRDRLQSTLAAGCAAMLVSGCAATILEGRAASMQYDPDRVAGLPATHGPTEVRPNGPAPTGTVKNTDHGDNDRLSLLAINDIEAFWTTEYPAAFSGPFRPVSTLISYDSTSPSSPRVCHEKTYQEPNAAYCTLDDSVAWDRGSFIPNARRYFGDISVPGVLGHELGHAVQHRAHLVTSQTLTIVKEQQADCFAGVYLRWVAEGHSPRFTMNTTDGLDHVLAGGDRKSVV